MLLILSPLRGVALSSVPFAAYFLAASALVLAQVSLLRVLPDSTLTGMEQTLLLTPLPATVRSRTRFFIPMIDELSFQISVRLSRLRSYVCTCFAPRWCTLERSISSFHVCPARKNWRTFHIFAGPHSRRARIYTDGDYAKGMLLLCCIPCNVDASRTIYFQPNWECPP